MVRIQNIYPIKILKIHQGKENGWSEEDLKLIYACERANFKTIVDHFTTLSNEGFDVPKFDWVDKMSLRVNRNFNAWNTFVQ